MPENINISEFIYIADTHLGADPIGFFQQHSYNEFLPEILQTLKEWILENGNIDFILHGGDIIDKTSEVNIKSAESIFSALPVPVYLCLGNHDLTDKASLELWLENSSNLLYENKPCYCIERNNYVIHVMPSHWCEKSPYYWNLKDQDIDFCDDRIQTLEKNLLRNADKQIQILVTHSPVFGIPTEQTGLEELFHPVKEKFTKTILNIVEQHSNLKLVLGAHNHVNTYLKKSDAHFVTASSFSEVPFEFKHFKIDGNSVSMSTLSLLENVDFKSEYNSDKTYVQGRPCDRDFEVTL